MRKKSVKKNYVYNMLYQLLIIMLPIITTPYLARRLGAHGNGIYGYTISIVTYFILFGSLGINMYGQREIAYAQKDRELRSKRFWELIIIKAITMSISALTFYVFFCNGRSYSAYYKILLLEMLANVIDISWFYQGMEDFKKTVIRNFIVKIISVICIFTFVKTHADLSKYLYIYVFSTLFGSLSLWFGLGKYVERPKKLKFVYHIPLIISMFIPQIAIQIYTVLDKTMIGFILQDMNEVGYYEQSQKIIKILLTIITAVGTVMMPRIANCYAEGDKKRIKAYMRKTFNFIFMLAFPLMFGIMIVAKTFSPLFFGPGYDKVPLLMSILSLIILFISMSNVTGTQFLLTTKRQKEFTTSVVVGALVNFVLNMILIKLMGVYGAAIATVIAEFTVTAVQLYFVRNDFDIKEILKSSKNYLFSALIMLVVCVLISKIMVGRMTLIITQVIVGGLVYLGVLAFLKDKLLRYIIRLVTRKAKKIIKK